MQVQQNLLTLVQFVFGRVIRKDMVFLVLVILGKSRIYEVNDLLRVDNSMADIPKRSHLRLFHKFTLFIPDHIPLLLQSGNRLFLVMVMMRVRMPVMVLLKIICIILKLLLLVLDTHVRIMPTEISKVSKLVKNVTHCLKFCYLVSHRMMAQSHVLVLCYEFDTVTLILFANSLF